MPKIDYSLFQPGNTEAENEMPSMPNYQYAADNHAYGNQNFAITDPTTWGTGLGNAGKFVVAAAASGVNSFYNTGVTVGNWLGADLKENDVATQLSALDDDLGKYYEDNRQYADLAGFIAASIVPGLAGIKLLNAGQKVLRTAQDTGMIGANLSRVTGLLTPSTKAYTTLAAGEIAQSSAAFSLTTGNALKAIGAGYGQAALEAAAFEIAVTATMFKSPVLSDMDGWDIAKNMAIGVGIGGVIGGAINHAVTYGAVKGAVKEFNIAEKQFADISDMRSLTPSQQVIARNERLSTLPEAPSAEQILSGEFKAAEKLLADLPQSQRELVAGQLAGKLSRLRNETKSSMELQNRSAFQELANHKDAGLANSLADLTHGLTGNQTMANMESLVEIGRVSGTLNAEKEVTKFINSQAKNDLASMLDDVTEAMALPKKIGFVKLSGEDVGKVSFETPKVLNLGDLHRNSDEVLASIKKYKFKEDKPWTPLNALDHNEAEARYIWADKAALKDGAKIGEHDIPLLERARELKLNNIEVISELGNYQIRNADDLMKHLQLSKQELAGELLAAKKAGTGMTTEEISKITNVKTSFLEGEQAVNISDDLFARQSGKAAYVKELEAKGFTPNEIAKRADEFELQPSYAKTAYDTKVMGAVDAHQISGMAYIKAQQKLYQQGVDNVFAKYTGEEFGRFWHPGDDMMLKTNRFGAGPGLVSFANGGYHTPESWAEAIGAATAGMQKTFKSNTSDQLQGVLHKIVSNQTVAVEFESINKAIMSTAENYVLAADGMSLKAAKIADWEASIAQGNRATRPTLQEGAAETIPFTSPDVAEAWQMRIKLNGERTTGFQEIRNAQGLTDMKDARFARPIRPDPKDFPFYAIVVDESITGVGHKSMIHAASASELEAMVQRVPNNFSVYKAAQLEEYKKAHGEFNWEDTLHENYIDSTLKKNGVNNPFFMRTDPQKIAKAFLDDHLRSDDIFTRELVNAKFEKEFRFLREQGEQYTTTATSKYTGSFRDIENSTKNPYLNYMKTALNVSQSGEHPLWMGLNQKLDAAVSKTWNVIGDAVAKTKTPQELDNLNQMLDKFGVKSAYYDAATVLLANHSAPKGVLTQFVGRANNIISTLVTRLDPFNAVNNAVGSTILYGSELKSFLRAMNSGENGELAGALTGLLKTPRASEGLLHAETAGGVEQVGTAGKLMQQAIKNWFDKEAVTASGKPLKEYYKANGWSTRLADQAQQMMDDLTLVGNETAGVMSQKMASAFNNFKILAEKGEKITGNKYAEEFNRFISADTMRQLTDLGIKAGKITEQESIGFINTFVNRTQGNVLATQRPLMFQGAVGQAVGLFQSYQFNLMQQLFRHVSEGQGKDAAMLLGLQGTMYGMNGLPGFNYLNTHIVGTMSGNPKHTDLYNATYGIAGKSVGDLLLYGLPSNMLRANLYTRGDINPRQISIIPVNPLDIPFVSAIMKAYDNAKNTLSKMKGGGSIWETLLQGVEHNGISRPLAGLAQVAQSFGNGGLVYSTTGKGSISGANELMSWSTAARLAGGKPFDEAIANDQTFRITAYQAADREKMKLLNATVKTSVISGNTPDADQVSQFAAKYAAIGGKQHNFNKYMLDQIRSANTSKANAIMENLKNPFSQKMQQVMDGTSGLDGRMIEEGIE